MINPRRHLTANIGLAILLLVSLQPALAAETTAQPSLSFCNSHWPPFSYLGQKEAPAGGYAVKFLQAISARTGIAVELSILPWNRCLLSARRGDVDGIMMLTRNAERDSFLVMTAPLLSDRNLLWYRKDSEYAINRPSFEDMQDLSIGLTRGFNYGDAFNSAVTRLNLKTESSPTILSNFKKLELGRIDVFLVNEVVANYTLGPYPELKAQFVTKTGPFNEVGLHIGLARKGRGVRYLYRFNQAIAAMTADGQILSIINEAPLDNRSAYSDSEQ